MYVFVCQKPASSGLGSRVSWGHKEYLIDLLCRVVGFIIDFDVSKPSM